MTRRVYVSEVEGGNVRGQPPVKWRDRVQEYVRERGGGSLRNLEQARRECQDREMEALLPWPSPGGRVLWLAKGNFTLQTPLTARMFVCATGNVESCE